MSNSSKSERRWLKAELHSHCSWDPTDYKMCSHTPEQLIARAAGLGYEVLAITCHDLDIWSRDLSQYAESLGITLVPGMEVTAEGGRHVLVYNFRASSENLNTIAKIRDRSRDDTLVIAPHAFFPTGSCLGGLLEPNMDAFDALELSGFHCAGLDFNRRARRIADAHDMPVVGNADVHMLWQLGRTFSWIYSEPGVRRVIDAVKRGRVRVESNPLSYLEVAGWWAKALWHRAFPIHPSPALPRPIPGALANASQPPE